MVNELKLSTIFHILILTQPLRPSVQQNALKLSDLFECNIKLGVDFSIKWIIQAMQ